MNNSISGAYHKELDFVLSHLAETKGKWKKISGASGVPYDTLTKVALRRVKKPGVATLEALAKYFRGGK